jgi:hypothetical protein
MGFTENVRIFDFAEKQQEQFTAIHLLPLFSEDQLRPSEEGCCCATTDDQPRRHIVGSNISERCWVLFDYSNIGLDASQYCGSLSVIMEGKLKPQNVSRESPARVRGYSAPNFMPQEQIGSLNARDMFGRNASGYGRISSGTPKEDSGTSQDGSKYQDTESEESCRVTRSPLPKGFAFFSFAVALLSFLITPLFFYFGRRV